MDERRRLAIADAVGLNAQQINRGQTKATKIQSEENMKVLTKTIVYLHVAAILVSAVIAGPTAADKRVPLHGVITAVETSSLEFPILSIESTGSGTATHLGRYTVIHTFEVDLTTFVAIGSAVLVAANGDRIFTDTVALNDAPIPTEDPDVILITELHTISGGTGRFVDASGSFIVNRALNTVTSITSGLFDGTISF